MFGKSSFLALLLLSSCLSFGSSLSIEGLGRSLVKRETEFQHPSLMPRTDSELEEASRQQTDRGRLMATFYRGLQLLGNDVADMSPQVAHSQQQHRLRLQRSPVNGEFNQSPTELLALEDERTIDRDLPDLLAQARNDKAMERALLKALINASLRSSFKSPDESGWRASESLATDNFRDNQPGSAGLEQDIDVLGERGSFSEASARQTQREQHKPTIFKREYTKPCSFNAVSCAKNPYRKLA